MGLLPENMYIYQVYSIYLAIILIEVCYIYKISYQLKMNFVKNQMGWL